MAAPILGDGLNIRSLTVRNNGDVYAVTQDELWLIRATGEKIKLDEGLKGGSGVALSPDGLWLFVAQSLSRTGQSYRVRADGTLDARAPFYDFDVPAWADDSGAAGIAMDRDGLSLCGHADGSAGFRPQWTSGGDSSFARKCGGDQPLFRRPRFRYALRCRRGEGVSEKAS